MTGLELTIFIISPLVSFVLALFLTPQEREAIADQEHHQI